MGEKLTRFLYKFWDGSGLVTKAINSWSPEPVKYEKDYEASLYAHLECNLSGLEITTQYAIGRSKADIVIERKCIIEIKLNFTKTAEYQRLIGQISNYKHWGEFIIVVLIGDIDKQLVKDLRKHAENLGLDGDDCSIGQNFWLICK